MKKGESYEPKLPGTLEEKVAQAKKLFGTLVKKHGIIRTKISMEKLEEDLRDLEWDIQKHLRFQGEELKDPLVDYCFANFSMASLGRCNIVKRFISDAKKYKGHKFLEMYGDSCVETGVITGSPEFKIELYELHDTHERGLLIPVEKYYTRDNITGKWKKGRSEYKSKNNSWKTIDDSYHVNSEIFRHPKSTMLIGQHRIWGTDHSDLHYIGGGPPAETTFYFGNAAVEDKLREMHMTIPRNVVSEEEIKRVADERIRAYSEKSETASQR